MAARKADKQGWYRMQVYGGQDRTGHYNFYKPTKNKDLNIWVEKGLKGKWLVKKSRTVNGASGRWDDFKIESEVVTQFDDSKEARAFVDQEFAHLFENQTT